MKVCVLSANLGGFDEPVDHVPQDGVEVTYAPFTDAEMPPRPRAMTARLQAKIPKMFGWDLRPGYDAYLWLDASLQLSQPDSVSWFLERLARKDIVVFRHPHRATIQEEADFLRQKLANGSRYIRVRYEGEDLDGQMAAIGPESRLPLLAAGAFCYRPTEAVKRALTAWWVHTSRFHCIDQLAFPFVIWQHNLQTRVIDEDIYKASHLTFTRERGHG